MATNDERICSEALKKYREGQKELHCEFVDIEKTYGRMARQQCWHCMRKSSVAEKYVKVVKDMYDESEKAVRCAAEMTEGFKAELGLHQGSTLSPFLVATVMD
nr:uncharacterized protein LOC113800007 [Penaeus vannamei]